MLYRVRIDGRVATQTYSYEQLIETGVKEFDDIYVQQVGDSKWHIAKYYDFPEAIEDDNRDYEIDEFGQIKRKTVSVETSASSTATHNNGNAERWIIFFKILGTIAIIVLTIVIIGSTHGITTPLAYGVWKLIEAIWKDK